MALTSDAARSLGTRQATLLGVTAIIGGAPIVLAGAAFAAAGPSALLAVALDGALALLGGFALAELGARFPRSGGPYMFTQRVMGLESAFAVGWLVLFGSLAAAAVFALGFASFALAMVEAAIASLGPSNAAVGTGAWAGSPAARVTLALVAIAAYGARGWRRPRRPPALMTLAKVVGMAGIGAAGLVALGVRPSAIEGVLGTFFVGGAVGVAQAMGMLFIAFQGFVLLSASAGDLREPARTLPRASLLTIAVATALYLPLFLVTGTVGLPQGRALVEFALATDATMVAVGAERYLGAVGFWWVALTAVISTLTALEAQLSGAARLARQMARDRTLPRWLARSGPAGVPQRAVATATAVTALLVLALPEVRTAGVAAGLIFLTVLALAHLLAVLVRRRSDPADLPYRAPWAPLSLWLGGAAAALVALVNAVSVPQAGVTVLAWLLLGALVFIAAQRTQARVLDAELEGAEPDVMTLRGRRPLILTPIANPANAEALVSVAHALAPPRVGRVTLLHIVSLGAGAFGASAERPGSSFGTAPQPGAEGARLHRPGRDFGTAPPPAEDTRHPRPSSSFGTAPPPAEDTRPQRPEGSSGTAPQATAADRPPSLLPGLATAQHVLGSSLAAAVALGLSPQALTTLADDPWDEIARVARTLDCEGLLLGLSDLSDDATLTRLDELLNRVRSDVVVLRAPPGWHLERCRRVVVPFAGRLDQERLRARVLGSLARVADPEVEIVRLLPQETDDAACRRAKRQLERLVEGRELGRVRCVAEATPDAATALTRRAATADLLVLGLPRQDVEHHALGAFAAAVAAGTPASCAVMLIHARG